jgi:hypothetical protein
MNMRRVSHAIGFATTLMLFGTVANAQSIVGSKHDLGAATGNTTEVCVFCHTPHGSDTSAAVPLWNKVLPSTTYQRYSTLNTSTLDGTEAPVGSVSLACLSCHDGTSAIDTVLNMPGSGMNSGQIDSAIFGTDMNDYLGGAATPVPVLGSDLRNDHPVSIQYAGGGMAGTDADGLQLATGFVDSGFNAVMKDTINGNPAWWVDSISANAVRDKTDMLLYTRIDGPIGAAGEPMVECASCHDPHNADTGIAAESVSFLRIENTSSQICTTCHAK